MKKTTKSNNLKYGGCDNCGKMGNVKARAGKGQWVKIFLCKKCRQDKTL